MTLECKNLGFYYEKSKWLFRNVDLTINPGEVVGISGYSGCGKTTLAKVLANYEKPREGQVLIHGRKKKNIGFQQVQLILQHPEKSMNPKWKMEKIINESYTPDKELLDTFGIKDEWMNRWPIELSGGELQRFSIVRSLNRNTKYIIADEMTTMLDGITQGEIWNKLLKICNKRNIGLIVVSHEKSILTKICDTIYCMNELNKNNRKSCCRR